MDHGKDCRTASIFTNGPVKFFVDENISPKVADLLRGRGIDTTSVHESGMGGASDLEIMEIAAADGRCVVTRNRDDFLVLTEQFFAEGRTHAGILVIPKSISAKAPWLIADAVERYARQHPEEVYNYLFDFALSQ